MAFCFAHLLNALWKKDFVHHFHSKSSKSHFSCTSGAPLLLNGVFFFLLFFNFPFWELPRFSNFKKIRLRGFQGSQVSQNFKPSIFKGNFYKSVLINKSRIFIFYFVYILGFFCVSFLKFIINDELVSKLIKWWKINKVKREKSKVKGKKDLQI